MKHYIDAPRQSEEFRRQFAEIRDSLLLRIEEVSARMKNCEYRACDIDGTPIAWVWDNDAFRSTGTVGKLADAKSFAGNMINQGMHFAYASCSHEDANTIWLTTWEAPEEGPVWPSNVEAIESEIHEGIFVGPPPSL